MGTGDNRHDFIIVIPVADRPQHLHDCLNSLQTLLRNHPYEGAVSVLIVDDSQSLQHIARHRACADTFTQQGLPAHHLDQDAQRALIAQLPVALRDRLVRVIGASDTEVFHHKGASLSRNIAYLWLNRLPDDGRKRLFWFIDSDQEFRVNVASREGEEQVYAIDYLHDLDQIFSKSPIRILTGKVVGDPPVSPAVMAGNFLDDVIVFLDTLSALPATAPCTFHGASSAGVGDAAYHDMADLFGFKQADATYPYHCALAGEHDHAACLADFAARVGRFFDGEHPTRRSFYQHEDLHASIKPARTIYTGNYVFTPEGLDYFIPFAALKLRMAGPTLGRIIRAEQGPAFVSANLPLLHKRTVDGIGQSEFRPGIERSHDRVDLSGEFERQYFGDVMLFSIERLSEQGFPGMALTGDVIAGVVEEIEAAMHVRYRAKQAQTASRVDTLATLFDSPDRWWQQETLSDKARADLRRFIDSMRHNFAADSPVWQRVGSEAHRQRRKAEICAAVAQYQDDRDAWRMMLGRARH